MSETDDTDLLLLIPPDFFLVHTPDIDSDCDISFSFDRDEVKDSIVSDLISQVNDLESRICMIEHLDRSTTCCSSCIEDPSFNHQSINSLTESDILRAHTERGKQKLPIQISLSRPIHMLESNEINSNDSIAANQRNLSDSHPNNDSLSLLIDSVKQYANITDKKCEQIKTICTVGSQDILVGDRTKALEASCNHDERNSLINEIDCFLEIKNKQNNGQISSNGSRPKNLGLIAQSSHNKEGEIKLNSHESESHHLNPEIKNDEQSLALSLPEVHLLLKEMEETQQEIEKKLKYRGLDFQSERSNSNNGEAINKSRIFTTSNITTSQHSNLEEFNTNKVNQSFNKQSENVHQRLKSLREGKYRSPERYSLGNSSNSQATYLLKPGLYDELSLQTDSKSVSLRCSPADSNLTSKFERSPFTSKFSNNKELPGKNPGFKRQLNFEATDIGLHQNQIKPRSIPNRSDEAKSNTSLENHKKDGNSAVYFPSSSNSKQAINLEGKHDYNISTQRVMGSKGNHIENCATRSATLEPKVSSNNLLSLSELWNKEPTYYSDDPSKLRQKLEEERYRRQHCEQQIQVLQVRVLEEQERLAVAIQVDQEKDKAIVQITESWRKLNNHWNELEEQRHSLAQQLQNEKEASKLKCDDLLKKVERWEKEVSQALDLAAGYKEKSENVQKQMDLVKKNTDEQLEEANAELLFLKEENEKLLNENSHLLDQSDEFRKKLDEEETLLSKLKVELEKCKKKCSEYEAEINILKEHKESLVNKIKDEKGRSSVLEQQKNNLQQALNDATKREKVAQDEARVSNERIEVARTELRALYQGQLEAVVKEKLQEFQCQLEAAEAALKAELQSKEKQWAEKANDQCRQLQEKHKIELYQKEESFRGEITKWKLRLMESEKIRSASESKLQEETSRRAEIAHRLHSVMETQWREALNIISNPLQNAYDVTKEESGTKWPSNVQGSGHMKASQSSSTASMSQVDEVPFSKEGLITSRPTQPQQEHQLKKYIEMLLERGPGNPNDTLQESLEQTFSQESIAGNRYMMDNAKKSVGIERFGHSSKPPWK